MDIIHVPQHPTNLVTDNAPHEKWASKTMLITLRSKDLGKLFDPKLTHLYTPIHSLEDIGT